MHIPDDIPGDLPGQGFTAFIKGSERLLHQGVFATADDLVGQVLGILITAVGQIVFDQEHLAGALVDHPVIIHLRLLGHVGDGKLQVFDHLLDDGLTRSGLIVQFRRRDDVGHQRDIAELEDHVIVTEGPVEISAAFVGVADTLVQAGHIVHIIEDGVRRLDGAAEHVAEHGRRLVIAGGRRDFGVQFAHSSRVSGIGIGADADIGNTHLHRQDAARKEIIDDVLIPEFLIAVDQRRADTRL